jgi:RNAse (barnase) inhibitor barstar
MKIIELDASSWSSEDDFYSALLTELGAPGWHGHNLNALWDSLTSDINEVRPPLSVVVQGASHLSTDIQTLFEGVSGLFADARNKCGIDVRFSAC